MDVKISDGEFEVRIPLTHLGQFLSIRDHSEKLEWNRSFRALLRSAADRVGMTVFVAATGEPALPDMLQARFSTTASTAAAARILREGEICETRGDYFRVRLDPFAVFVPASERGRLGALRGGSGGPESRDADFAEFLKSNSEIVIFSGQFPALPKVLDDAFRQPTNSGRCAAKILEAAIASPSPLQRLCDCYAVRHDQFQVFVPAELWRREGKSIRVEGHPELQVVTSLLNVADSASLRQKYGSPADMSNFIRKVLQNGTARECRSGHERFTAVPAGSPLTVFIPIDSVAELVGHIGHRPPDVIRGEQLLAFAAGLPKANLQVLHSATGRPVASTEKLREKYGSGDLPRWIAKILDHGTLEMIQVTDRRSPERSALVEKRAKLEDFMAAVSDELRTNVSKLTLFTEDQTAIDRDNWSAIAPGERLFLMNEQDGAPDGVPLSHIINFTPHPNAICDTGLFGHYKKRFPCAFAIGEFIDNSLSAIRANDQKCIQVVLDLHPTPERCKILVFDNGCGMSSRGISSWATFALSPEERNALLEDSDSEKTISLTGNISRYGVGAKQGGFFLGNQLTITTKQRGIAEVNEFTLDKDMLLAEFRDRRKSLYNGSVSQKPGPGYDPRFGLPAAESFTVAAISKLNLEHLGTKSAALDIQSYDSCDLFLQNLACQLKHAYYFYVAGRPPRGLESEAPAPARCIKADIVVRLLYPGKASKEIRLADVKDSLMDQLFTASASCEPLAFGGSYKRLDQVISFCGLALYCPFVRGEESMPRDRFRDDVQSTFLQQQRAEIFWMGRLIPHEDFSPSQDDAQLHNKTVKSLAGFCAPTRRKELPSEVYHRVKFVLFFGKGTIVKREKLSFLDGFPELDRGECEDLWQIRGEEHLEVKRKNIAEWLKGCHDHDTQFHFGKDDESVEIASQQSEHASGAAGDAPCLRYKKDDIVVLKSAPTKLFSIKEFRKPDKAMLARVPQLLSKRAIGVSFHELFVLYRPATQIEIDSCLDQYPSRISVYVPFGTEVRTVDKEIHVYPAEGLTELGVALMNPKGIPKTRLPKMSEAIEVKQTCGATSQANKTPDKKQTYWFKPIRASSSSGRVEIVFSAFGGQLERKITYVFDEAPPSRKSSQRSTSSDLSQAVSPKRLSSGGLRDEPAPKRQEREKGPSPESDESSEEEAPKPKGKSTPKKKKKSRKSKTARKLRVHQTPTGSPTIGHEGECDDGGDPAPVIQAPAVPAPAAVPGVPEEGGEDTITSILRECGISDEAATTDQAIALIDNHISRLKLAKERLQRMSGK